MSVTIEPTSETEAETGTELGISRQWSRESGNSAKAHYYLATKTPKIMCGNSNLPTRSGKQAEYAK